MVHLIRRCRLHQQQQWQTNTRQGGCSPLQQHHIYPGVQGGVTPSTAMAALGIWVGGGAHLLQQQYHFVDGRGVDHPQQVPPDIPES